MTTLTIDRPAVPEAAAPAPQPTTQRWVKPALITLLVATTVLYLWGLGASGWANSFYSAAVQAGTKSWKAFFFGISDASNFITVDKPPAALWVMELSARMFGVNAWSILVPQALEGVAAVAVLFAAVRRWFGASAGLLAGAILALTPVAALMFRFNNPDVLLVLLLTIAVYAVIRAIEGAQTKWLVLAASLVGLGFITKMLQALLVVPAFALAYLIAAPASFWKRIAQLFAAGVALIVSSLWWVVAVMAVPAASRPYIGGSQNNSLWNLIFGYNGFGRLTGNETGSVGGGGRAGGVGMWGATGLTRLFGSDMGTQISWLLPTALILLVAGLAITLRAKRTDRTRAALVIWGGWLIVTGLTFSLGKGIIHPYYTVALAPAIGAVVAIGASTMWARRDHWAARVMLAAAVGASAIWSYRLLARTPSWNPWLRPLVLIAGLAIAALMVAWSHMGRRLGAALAAAAVVVSLAGPAAYSIATAATAHSGSIPTAGPSGGGGFGPGGGRPGGGAPGGTARFAGAPPAGAFGGGTAGGFAGGAAGGNAGGPAGGVGGLLNGSTSNAALNAALDSGSATFTWVAAAVGSNTASGYQLATGKPVMAIGGFNGTDPTPTLAQFERYVQEHKIHYFIAGGGGAGPGGGGSSESSSITSWVESNYTATTVGGVTLYDLSVSK